MSSENDSVEAYFRAVEETFIRLRGAPLLLSPADWKAAEAWHEEGIPLELVESVLEEVFERLRERDPERRIHSLRYCAPAVEAAWREVRDLTATAGRLEPEPIDVAGRLDRLAAALARASEGLPADERAGLEELEERLRGLEGNPEEVERDLEALDREMLDLCAASLEATTRKRLEKRAERALERARDRVEAEELEGLLERLEREGVRRELDLPTLSLFSSESESDDAR